MVESEGGYARRPTENCHEALRDLREDDVVFGNREPKGADVLVTQIAGCIVNRATPNMEVDVLEPAIGPRRGFRRKIDHIRTKGGDPSRRNDLAIYPEAVLWYGDRFGEDRNEQSGDGRRLSNCVGQWSSRLHADSREPIGVAVRPQRRRLVETHRTRPRFENRACHRCREVTTAALRS